MLRCTPTRKPMPPQNRVGGDALEKRRLLLPDDVQRYIEQAQASPVLK